MSRRKIENRNVRSLSKTSGGRSYSVTLPIEVIRLFRWQKRQRVQITVDEKGKRIIISDWED